jgi:hypothetical protein
MDGHADRFSTTVTLVFVLEDPYQQKVRPFLL